MLVDLLSDELSANARCSGADGFLIIRCRQTLALVGLNFAGSGRLAVTVAARFASTVLPCLHPKLIANAAPITPTAAQRINDPWLRFIAALSRSLLRSISYANPFLSRRNARAICLEL